MPRRTARLLQTDKRLCVGGKIGDGGGEREGSRGIVDAHTARRDKRADRAGSFEGEVRRLTGCLHGEREDECPDAGGAVTVRLEVVRHAGAIERGLLHVECGEWR